MPLLSIRKQTKNFPESHDTIAVNAPPIAGVRRAGDGSVYPIHSKKKRKSRDILSLNLLILQAYGEQGMGVVIPSTQSKKISWHLNFKMWPFLQAYGEQDQHKAKKSRDI